MVERRMIWRTREGEVYRRGINWDFVPRQSGRSGCGLTVVFVWPWRNELNYLRLRLATSYRLRLIVNIRGHLCGSPYYFVIPLSRQS